eukprot:2262269-Ditylum_brightwellii.AAC.2
MASNFHTWSCPIFVLDSRSQSSTGIGPPEWDPKARAGIYLGHVSSQYHVVFDDEFSTVPYLQSSEPPPKWIDLVQNHTECATEESFNISSSWYEGEGAHRIEPADPTEEMKELPKQDFINIEIAGLRRIPRLGNQDIKGRTGFVITVIDIINLTPAYVSQCFQANRIRYQEFLETSFDGTHNNLLVIGQAFSAKLNNENYMLKEMLQPPDREEFEQAMYKEITHIFDKKVWEKVP